MGLTILRDLVKWKMVCKFIKMIQNFIAIHKIILSNIFVLWTAGCILQKSFIPIDVNIPKNQMIYRDQKMDIWAHDGFGAYHHYTPEDSAQYFTVANYLSSHLESTFAGYCNKHKKIEIVNVTPKIVSVMTGPNDLNNNSESALDQKYGRKNEVGSGGRTSSGISVIRTNTQGETHQTIQSEQRSGGSSGKKN